MCIIIIARNRLPETILRKAFAVNDDGAGFAYTLNGRIHVHKGMMSPDALVAAYAEVPETVNVVHCRIATAGKVKEDLTQPFVARSDGGLSSGLVYTTTTPVVFHNGHISGWEVIARASGVTDLRGWNDSRTIARLVARCGADILVDVGTKTAIMYPNGRVYYYGQYTRDEETGAMLSSSLATYNYSRYLAGAGAIGHYGRWAEGDE